ncbi:hypothetical protein DFS34DRAFT_651722 [Phlyctochytrium arcticum]|nr:hypothetical protein DFS34DRAFT_651722 [Phlyctochytrium arcticum]
MGQPVYSPQHHEQHYEFPPRMYHTEISSPRRNRARRQFRSPTRIRGDNSNASGSSRRSRSESPSQQPIAPSHNKWIFTTEEVQSSPSRQHGVHPAAEQILRNKGAQFIIALACELKRVPRLIHPGCLYFHRFYMRNSLRAYREYRLIAATCFWIASKLDDRPIRLSHIVEVTLKILHKDSDVAIDRESTLFSETRKKILFYEIEVFDALCFDSLAKDPYNCLINLLRKLNTSRRVKNAAMAVLNDIYISTVCLQYESRILTPMAVFMGARIMQEDLPQGKDGSTWHEVTKLQAQEDRETFRDGVGTMYKFYQDHARNKRPVNNIANALEGTVADKDQAAVTEPAEPTDSGVEESSLGLHERPCPEHDLSHTASSSSSNEFEPPNKKIRLGPAADPEESMETHPPLHAPTRTSFREMVARKREQVAALAGPGALPTQNRRSIESTIDPLSSGAPKLAKVRSVPRLPSNKGNSDTGPKPLPQGGRKQSIHSSYVILSGPHQGRNLPALEVPPKHRRPGSGGSVSALSLGSSKRAADVGSAIIGNRIGSLQPSSSMGDLGRFTHPQIQTRQQPQQVRYIPSPTTAYPADDEDQDDRVSSFSRSNRSSITSLASSMSDAHTNSTRHGVKKRPFKPPPELPRWNTSTKVVAKKKQPKDRSGAGVANSSEEIDIAAQTSVTPDDEELDSKNAEIDEDDDDSIEDEEEDVYTETQYPVTPYQLDIYSKLCPTQDDIDSSTQSLYSGPPFFISQSYRLRVPVEEKTFVQCVKRVVNFHVVLRTRFYRNEKIVDADVEGQLDRREWSEIPDDELVQFIDVDSDPGLTVVNGKTLTKYTQGWMASRDKLDKTWMALVFNDSPLAARSASRGSSIVFVTSSAVSDEMSFCWICQEVLDVYGKCQNLRSKGSSNADIDALISSVRPKEYYDFVAFAYDMESKPSRHAVTYWKSQCIETVQEVVDPVEKADIQTQLARMEKEQVGLRAQLETLKRRKADAEVDLHSLREQRKQMEGTDQIGDEVTIYQDPLTGEIIRISPAAKIALYKTVFGDEADTPEGTIVGLLEKHEVPIEVQRKINATTLTVETFAAVTEAQLHDTNLLTKDRRKILALAEYVRNRIKECLQELNKVKFTLERRIAKSARDFESVSEGLKNAQDALDGNDDMCIRLTTILRPPYVEMKIPPLCLDQHAMEGCTDPDDIKDYTTKYGFAPIKVSAEVLQNLRLFHDGQRATARQRRLRPQSSTTSDSGISTEESSADSEDVHNQFGAREHRRRLSSAIAVCLAAYAVLLKHIAGSDKYLIGLTQSFRRNGLVVGPVTDVLPIKFDLTRKGMTFNTLYGLTSRSLKEIRRYGPSCPLTSIQGHLGIARTLPVQFEYISYREHQTWLDKGLSEDDLLLRTGQHHSQKDVGSACLGTERRWFRNEVNDCDIKLVLVETAGELIGGFRYRQNKFDAEHVSKWANKYAAILEDIDAGPRQIAITSIISRFYQTLWQSNPAHALPPSDNSGSFAHEPVGPIAEE